MKNKKPQLEALIFNMGRLMGAEIGVLYHLNNDYIDVFKAIWVLSY